MTGFAVEPDVLLDQARRRDGTAATLDGIAERLRGTQGDDLGLGVLCSWVLGDVRESVEAVTELVRTLGRSNGVLATELRESAADHRATDEDVAAVFWGAR